MKLAGPLEVVIPRHPRYDGKSVASKMRGFRVNDFFAKGQEIRADGRLIHASSLT